MYIVRFFNNLRKEIEHAHFSSQADLDSWMKHASAKFFWQGKIHASDLQLYRLEGTIQLQNPIFTDPVINKIQPSDGTVTPTTTTE